MSQRRTFPPKVFVPLFLGFMGLAAFTNTATSARFATIPTIDVVRLMASGLCIGAAVSALIIFFAGRRKV